MKKHIPDKLMYFPLVILLAYFIIRLVDQGQMIFEFPLHYTNDSPGYMALLYFFIKYGYYGFVPDWFNGFTLFQLYAPGWFFFALPIYFLVRNIQLTTYISLLLMFFFIFIAIYLFGRSQGFSKVNRILFFLILFGNPIAVGNFIRLTRVSELFGWMNFIILSCFLIYYKDNKIDKKFLWFVPFYIVFLISHPAVNVLFHFMLLPLMLFLIKPFREKIIILVSVFIGLIASLFWWLPFLKSVLKQKAILSLPFFGRLLTLDKAWLLNNIASFIVVIFLLSSFYFYWLTENKSRKELLFFCPIIILSLLFVSRLLIFVPLLKNIFPGIYMIAFLFFGLFFLFKINLEILSSKIKKIIYYGLILMPIIFVTVSAVHTSFYVGHTQLEKDAIALLPYIDDKFFVLNSPSVTLHGPLFYSYASIYYDLKTPYGTNTFGMVPLNYMEKLSNVTYSFNDKDYDKFVNLLNELDNNYLITFNEDCDVLKNLGFSKVAEKNNVCLYKIV